MPWGSYADTFCVCKSEMRARICRTVVPFSMSRWNSSSPSTKDGSPRFVLSPYPKRIASSRRCVLRLTFPGAKKSSYPSTIFSTLSATMPLEGAVVLVIL